MRACKSCQLRGYSRELCYLHIHRCHGNRNSGDAPPSLGLVGRVAMGVAVGVFGALAVSVAASFFSGLELFRSLLPVLVIAGSIPGAVYGFVQGYQETRARERPDRRSNTRKRCPSHVGPSSSRARRKLIFVGHATGASRTSGSAGGCH
jgi:hypothetical protein